MMLSPFEMSLNALLDGISVTLEGHTYRLFKPNEEIPLDHTSVGYCDGYFLGVEMTRSNSCGDSYKVYLGSSFTFTDILDMLLKVSKEDGLVYASQNAVNKIKKYSIRERVIKNGQ